MNGQEAPQIKVYVVVAVPMTVNAFLVPHLIALSEQYQVTLIFNGRADQLPQSICHIPVICVPIVRNISPRQDMIALLKLVRLFRKERFNVVHSFTPKAGFLAALAGFVARVLTRIHWFTGQVWTTKRGFLRQLLKAIDRITVACTTHQLVDSHSQRMFLADQGVLGPGCGVVLASGSICGVDLAKFQPNLQARSHIRVSLGIAETFERAMSEWGRDQYRLAIMQFTKSDAVGERHWLNMDGPSQTGSYHRTTVLVTGGAGFIGSHLAEALVASGARVRVLDSLETGHAKNIPPQADFVRGCVTDESVVEKCIAGCSHVFHLGAMVSVPATVSDPDRCFAVNVVGTKTVIGAASKAGVAGFVHTSTAAVYGSEPRLPSCEDDPICCESPYAASKACGELLIQAAARSAGFPGIALRLFNVFGPRQDPRSPYAAAISAFIDAATSARPVKIYGSGLQTRDFVPVTEVVRAFMHAGLHAHAHAGRCFNIGLGKETSILQMAAMIQQSAGATASYEFQDRRPGDVQRSCASLTRTVELLDFEPRGDLGSSVRALVQGTNAPAR